MPALISLFSFLGKMFGQTLIYTTFAIGLMALVFTSAWIFGDDLFMFLANKIFSFLGYLISSNEVDTAEYDFMYYIHQLPQGMKDLLVVLDFSYCMKIILSAITVRFMLNLIPFVRV